MSGAGCALRPARGLRARFLPFCVSLGLLACGGGAPAPPAPAPAPAPTASDRYVKAHQVALTSLVADSNVEDLTPLAVHFENRRIVQLGESTHGSREMNQVKVRLVQYLHQQLGFDVIAFESSVFGCNQEREREPGIAAVDLMKACLFNVWHTDEVKTLFEYILATQGSARPLRLAGFDVQLSAPGYESADRLAAYLAAADPEQAAAAAALGRRAHAANDAAQRCYIDKLQTCPAFDSAQSGLRDELIALSRRLLDNAARDPSADARPALIARSLADLTQMHDRWFRGDPRRVWRDEGMATNLSALATTVHPGRRIIVWAHNTHIAKDFPDTHDAAIDDRPMGMFLDRIWGAELYTVGLYMVRGVSASVNREPMPVMTHSSGSLEALIASSAQAPLFLPFPASDLPGADDDWLHRPLETKLWGQFTQVLTPARAFDAVLLIDQSSLPHYLH